MRLEHHPGSSCVAVCHHANFHCPCFERVYQDTLGFDDNCWVAKQWSAREVCNDRPQKRIEEGYQIDSQPGNVSCAFVDGFGF